MSVAPDAEHEKRTRWVRSVHEDIALCDAWWNTVTSKP